MGLHSAGRGLSVGLVHALILRKTVRQHIGEPATLVAAYDAETERQVTPFYRDQIAADRFRVAEMNGLLDRPAREPDPVMSTFAVAALNDAEVFRAFLETISCVALPQEVMARPHAAEDGRIRGSRTATGSWHGPRPTVGASHRLGATQTTK